MANKDAPRRQRKKLKKEDKDAPGVNRVGTSNPVVEVTPKGKAAKEPKE